MKAAIIAGLFCWLAAFPTQGWAQTGPAKEYLSPLGIVSLDGVEGRLDHLAADAARQRLFVAALENHSVEVVDLAKRVRADRITGILEPQGLAFIPEAGRLIVACRGDGLCRSFDAQTLEEGPWIDLGHNADNVRFDSESRTIFVGSGGEPGAGRMSAIALASLLPVSQGGHASLPKSPADLLLDRPRQGDPLAEAELPSHPESFQIDLAGHRLLVNVPDDHEIAVIDVTKDALRVSAHWPVTVAERNFPMALDSIHDRLYIAGRKPALLLAYDARKGTLVAQAPCPGDADDLFYDPATRRLIVLGGEGFFDVFQVPETGDGFTRVQRLATAPRARTGLFIPEQKLLVVAVPHTAGEGARLLLFSVGP